MAGLAGAGAIALPISAAEPFREVNVTTESVRGWVPSVELERQARAGLAAFLDARDHARYGEAYEMLSAGNRAEGPDAYARRQAELDAQAGPLVDRQITKLTWSKDPKSAPAPGVYAAFDLVSRFAGIDRHCGYVVLYQPPMGGPFQVARTQDAFLDNKTAAEMARKRSKTSVGLLWEKVAAASCPNYRPPPLDENDTPHEGPGVAATLAELRARRGVTIAVENGWTVATEASTTTLWSFAPSGHPAYPSVVRRQIRNEGGRANLETSIHCEASKAACDNLVREFEKLDNAVAASRRRSR